MKQYSLAIVLIGMFLSGCSYFTSFEVGGYEATHSASILSGDTYE